MFPNFWNGIALMSLLVMSGLGQEWVYSFESAMPFKANGTRLPAGNYRLAPVKGSSGTYRIEAADGTVGGYLALTARKEPALRGETAKVWLVCSGEDCQLSRFEDPARGVHTRLPTKPTVHGIEMPIAVRVAEAKPKSNR